MDSWMGPHTWKWAVPAAMALLLGYVSVKLIENHALEAALAFMFAGLFLVMALMNWWRLYSSHREDLHEQHMRALSITPVVLLAQSMRQMHPDAIKVLNRYGVQTSWQVRVNASLGTRDWTLLDTNVHFGFIEYVLSKSNGALYPKNKFSEGSKKWDPDGLVEDRQQYDELEKWLFARLMVTRSHGDFKPAEFIPPWTPASIMDVMGMSGEQDLFYPDEAKTSFSGNGKNAEVPEFIEKALEGLQTTKAVK